MRFGNDYCVTQDMTAGYVEKLARRTEHELVEAVLAKMEHGKRYVVRITEKPIVRNGDCFTAGFRVDIEECREERVVLMTLEERHLTPAATWRQRLKNCAEYLRAGMKRHK